MRSMLCRVPQPLDVARCPELRKYRPTARANQPQSAPLAALTSGSIPQPTPSAQGPWPGTDLLKFVPEQQFKLLLHSQQLIGTHQHLGASYAVSAAAVELAAQEGKAALVVGSVHLAAQLRSELPDVQVRATACSACLRCSLVLSANAG